MLKLVFGEVRGALLLLPPPLARRLNNEDALKVVILERFVYYSGGKI